MADAGQKPPRMSVDRFLVWSEDQPGRHELVDGEVVRMQAERESHNLVKLSVVVALRQALAGKATGCRALTDGMAIRIDEETAFEPDALVDCGPRDPEARLASKPVIVVEVTSPSPSRIDENRKFLGYFTVPSIQHYLLVDIRKRLIVHHRRNGEEIATRILPAKDAQDLLTLDPPGISVRIADFFSDLDAGT